MKGLEMPPFMSPRITRLLKWVFISVIGLTILLWIGSEILSGYIHRTAQSRLEEMGGKFSDLDVNLFTRSVTVSDFEFSQSGGVDSIPTLARIKKIAFKNVSIYQLLANKSLLIDEVLVEDGQIVLNRAIEPKDTATTQEEAGPKALTVGRLILENLAVSVLYDSSKEFSGTLNATLSGIQSSDTAEISNLEAFTLKDIDVRITSLLISKPTLYQIEVANIHATSDDEKLVLDSLLVTPKYTKFNFAQVAGKQTDRINTFIPRIEIVGLKYDALRDSSLIASKIEMISAEVHSFRDKRQPFRETKNKPLPIAALKEMSFGIEIDTIRIKKSRISYEEFASEGFESGTIVFEDLNATLTSLSNRAYYNKPDHATLQASTKLMGEGLIEATFKLPFEGDKSYHAEGKIGKMALDQLNPPLQGLAFIRVQSGTLNGLNFNFDYNDQSSNGAVTINYQDLKIDGLKKEKNPAINDLKSLLINTVIKNDKDKSVPLEKRTGTIEFERDKKRQIFNYWWKSLFSGIKSSVIEN